MTTTTLDKKDNNLIKSSILGTALVAGLVITGVSQKANADQITIHKGDTLSALAVKNNTTVSSLMKQNNLKSDLIITGHSLETGHSQTTVKSSTSYVVQSGDTLSGISAQTGISVSQLMNLNHLSSSLIMVGQRLQLRSTVQQPASQSSQSQSTASQSSTSTASQASSASQSSTVSQATPGSTVQSSAAQQSTNDSNNHVATSSIQSAPSTQSSYSGGDSSAKAWIASHESGGSYTARNGRYIGKYQLDSSYLHGDYSPANQERVANQYVQSRYGSWSAAKNAWQTQGWY